MRDSKVNAREEDCQLWSFGGEEKQLKRKRTDRESSVGVDIKSSAGSGVGGSFLTVPLTESLTCRDQNVGIGLESKGGDE